MSTDKLITKDHCGRSLLLSNALTQGTALLQAKSKHTEIPFWLDKEKALDLVVDLISVFDITLTEQCKHAAKMAKNLNDEEHF